MTDTISTKPILSVCVTTSNRLKDLAIKDGQLIFVRDNGRIALDFGGGREFYNQIIELSTDEERKEMLTPIVGMYYFVIKTAVLWTYQDDWIQVTTPPTEILFVGATLPELGSENKIYVNKTKANISVWSDDIQDYMIVGEKVNSITFDDIESLF